MKTLASALLALLLGCAMSRSAESQTDSSKIKDTEVIHTTQTGPETITTTIDRYGPPMPPACGEGQVLWPDWPGSDTFHCGPAPTADRSCPAGQWLWNGPSGHYCASPDRFKLPLPKQATGQAPKPVPHPDPNRQAGDQNDQDQGGVHQPVQPEHGPLLSHEVTVVQKGPSTDTTSAKGHEQSEADKHTETASKTRTGPGPLGWTAIALGLAGAALAVWRFKLWRLL